MKPVLQALILADRIYDDRTTGKKIIAGTFNTLLFKKGSVVREVTDEEGKAKVLVPGGMQAGSPYLYVSLTDLRGKAPFVLRYVDLAQNKVLFQTQFEAVWNDPLQTLEIVLPLPSLPVECEGIHALELLCHDELIGSLRITVKELKDEQATGEEHE